MEGKPHHQDGTPGRPRVLAGKYRLLSVLGQGGMGTVWRAEHLGLGAMVAVKLIDPKAASGAEALRQCQKEASAAAALRSPHVVQVLDFGMDEETGSPFIVMELLEGESLADRLARQNNLSPPEASRVLTHMARALGRAHEAGIIHRDLKPANVFLVRNEDEELAKVLDFGTARVQRTGVLQGSKTPTSVVIGTPHYMSPEHLTGQSLDHRTDLWAMAVIAFECLTGQRPFEADEIGQLVLQVCSYPMPVPSAVARVPAGFDDWFRRGTQRDVNQRFRSARELADELRRICFGTGAGSLGSEPDQSVPATLMLPPSTVTALPTAARRRRTARWIAGGVVAIAALTAVAINRSMFQRANPLDPVPAAPVPAETSSPTPVRSAPVVVPPSTGLIATPPATAPVKPARRFVRRNVSSRPAEAAPRPTAEPAGAKLESVLDHRR